MSSTQKLQSTDEPRSTKNQTLHVTFKGADSKPKHCTAEDVKQIKDGADCQVVVDTTVKEDYIMVGSMSKKEKEKRQEIIAECREFLARTEAKMAKKLK
ncbi:MAG: hypothetical protein Q9228_004056 [Teloschistes exilis]